MQLCISPHVRMQMCTLPIWSKHVAHSPYSSCLHNKNYVIKYMHEWNFSWLALDTHFITVGLNVINCLLSIIMTVWYPVLTLPVSCVHVWAGSWTSRLLAFPRRQGTPLKQTNRAALLPTKALPVHIRSSHASPTTPAPSRTRPLRSTRSDDHCHKWFVV